MSNLHIVKYAKGHYGTKHTLRDLDQIIGKWSGWDGERTTHDILLCVNSVWAEHALEHDKNHIFMDLFCSAGNKTAVVDIPSVIKIMLQHLRWVSFETLPENYDMFFGSEKELEKLKNTFPSFFAHGI